MKQEAGAPFQFALSKETDRESDPFPTYSGQAFFSQYPHELAQQWLPGHSSEPMMTATQENEMTTYIHTPEERIPASSRPILPLLNPNVIALNGDLHPYIQATQGGMSQSPLSQTLIPRQRVNTSRIRRRANGYGKIAFVKKPDTLGNFNTWTLQERQDNRRIVVFTKNVRGGTIHLDCSYILPQDYKEHMMTISCIRWAPGPPTEPQHKYAGQCVFTSVDIILLGEKLVDHNFRVHEKNRIRRNLEGYSPETVKKEGATHRFFNQIMSYSSPKTRNIEKDIKVFLWDTIIKAMRKIVQKYLANQGVPNGRPISEVQVSVTGLEPLPVAMFSSLPSSSQSNPTQNSFANGQYAQQAPIPTEWAVLSTHRPPDFPYEYPFETGPTSAIFGRHEDSGEGSNSSISPQSQVSQAILPMGFPQEGDRGQQQQLQFGVYPTDDSSDLLV
jgi:hypothetical protein